MHRTLLAVAILVVSLLPCCTTWHEQLFVGSSDYELARVESSDGTRETYELRAGRTLRVHTERPRERPFLGFKVEVLDAAYAAARGLEPDSGLLVLGSYPDSSARLAGVREGDLLLTLAGQEVIAQEQLAKVEDSLVDGQPVTAKLRRGDQQVELVLFTRLLRERVSDSQELLLEPAPTPQRAYAGVTLYGVPSVWCERIFGEQREAVVIGTVEVGSPAWLAGIRGGDVIEAVDGAPVPPVAELSRRIAAQGAAGATMRWLVRREEGRAHEALITLADYSGEAHFGIPLLFSVTDGTCEDRWSLGLGLIMGNRNHYVADTSTRRVQTRNVFSALLGLIRVEARPDETRVRLLWLIHFDT